VPAALEAVCLKAMAVVPDDRYAGADELARDVRRYLADEPVSARREALGQRCLRWARRNRSVVVGAAMLLGGGAAGRGGGGVAALAGGLWAVSRERDRTAVQRDEALAAERRAETEKSRAEENAARTREALDAAKRNLEQAESNLLLARKAVDDCSVLAVV